LGGLFVPEAYVTATRQYVAQAQSHSLEELSLRVRITEHSGSISLDEKTFAVSGENETLLCKKEYRSGYTFVLINSRK